MVDRKYHTVDSILEMSQQCILFMDTAARVWDTMPLSLKHIFKSLNFPEFPNYLDFWSVVASGWRLVIHT